MTIALQDTPNNILRRITFYDIDSRPIVKELTEAEKALYRKEIKEDVTFFSRSYERADLRVDISGLGAECSAEMIAGLLARRISGRT